MIRYFYNKLLCSKFSLIPFVCFFTVLTYGEVLPTSIKSSLAYALWIIVFFECVLTCKLRLSKQAVTFIGLGAFFFFLVLILTVLGSGNTYFNSSICLTVGITIMIFFCGTALGNKLNENDVEVILRWFVLGTIVMGTVYFFLNLSTGFNLSSRVYNNVSFNKNSASQLISSSICILIIGDNRKDIPKYRVLNIGIIIYLTLILLLMRSRSCILCFSFSVIIILLSKYTNKTVKKWIICLSFVAVLVLVFSEGIRKILIEQLLFANRDASSLDDLTSGRITIYSGFGNLIKGHEFVGNGALYFECFYLSAIVQFGIPVGLFLWGYVAYAIYSVKKIYSYFCYGWLMMILVLSYSLNGLFEGLPPFGPGTKNFLLWLVFGIASSQLFYIDKRSINMDQNQS